MLKENILDDKVTYEYSETGPTITKKNKISRAITWTKRGGRVKLH